MARSAAKVLDGRDAKAELDTLPALAQAPSPVNKPLLWTAGMRYAYARPCVNKAIDAFSGNLEAGLASAIGSSPSVIGMSGYPGPGTVMTQKIAVFARPRGQGWVLATSRHLEAARDSLTDGRAAGILGGELADQNESGERTRQGQIEMVLDD